MRVIQSFWSAPGGNHHWPTMRHFLASQLLSLESARRVYGAVHLYTDTPGATLFDRAGINYDSVTLALDGPAPDPRWWVWGKLRAYSLQTGPFVHIDADAYLWGELPPAVEGADLICQSLDTWATATIDFGAIYDRPRQAMEGLLQPVPGYWQHAEDGIAINAGIIGGRRWDILRAYAQDVLSLLADPSRLDGLDAEHRHWAPVFLEQQLAYCYAAEKGLSFTKLTHHLTEGRQQVWTHVMGEKSSVAVADRIVERVGQDYPDGLRRIDEALALPVAFPSGLVMPIAHVQPVQSPRPPCGACQRAKRF